MFPGPSLPPLGTALWGPLWRQCWEPGVPVTPAAPGGRAQGPQGRGWHLSRSPGTGLLGEPGAAPVDALGSDTKGPCEGGRGGVLVLWGPPAPLTHVGCQGNGPLDQVGAGLLGSGSPHRPAVHGDPPLPQPRLSVHGRPWRGPGHRGRGRGRKGRLGDAVSTGVSEAVRGPHQGRGWGTPSFLSRPPGALCCLSLEPPALNPQL